MQAYSDEEKMSFKLFIHHNVVDTIEQLCLAARELIPDDDILKTDEFNQIAPPSASYRDSEQFRSMDCIFIV
jgi:hypothetical protein